MNGIFTVDTILSGSGRRAIKKNWNKSQFYQKSANILLIVAFFIQLALKQLMLSYNYFTQGNFEKRLLLIN